MIDKVKNKILILLGIFILVIPYYRWFSLNYFKEGDWSYYFSNVMKELYSMPLLESSTGTTYYQIDTAWKIPFNFLTSIFGIVGLDSRFSDFILIFLPIILLNPLIGFLINKKIFNSSLAGFFGALVFSFNSYYLAIGTQGHQFLTVGFIFSSFFFYFSCIENRSGRNKVLSFIFLFLSTIYDLRTTYIILLIYGLYNLYLLYLKKISIHIFIKDSLLTLLFLIFSLSHFLLPNLFASKSIRNSSILGRSLFGDQFMDLSKALTIHHPFWSGDYLEWFIKYPIPWHFFVLPFVSVLGLILNKKNKYVRFFGILAILGILLGKQSSSPFPDLYNWLFLNFPGFNAFRESTKFYYITILSYSVLTGSVIAYLEKNRNIYFNLGKYKLTISKSIICFLISIPLVLNALPLIKGRLGFMYNGSYMPEEYSILGKKILDDNSFYRTLWIPYDSRWGYFTSQNPKINLANMLSSEWSSNWIGIFADQYNENIPYQEILVNTLKQDFSNNLFDISGIRYVIIPIKNIKNEGNGFIYYGENTDPNIRQWYVNEINKISWLQKVDIGTKDLTVYENKNFKPQIYTTDSQESLYNNLEYKSANSTKINNTEYRINLNNIKKITYLNFNSTFNKDWKLIPGSFNWINITYSKNYSLDDKFHVQNSAGLNSWTIDPEYIKANFDKSYYKENPDGSIDIELTLYFKPQSYFYLGIIISCTTLILCFGYLGYTFYRQRWRKKFSIDKKIHSNLTL